jgi:hypothetical protein
MQGLEMLKKKNFYRQGKAEGKAEGKADKRGLWI